MKIAITGHRPHKLGNDYDLTSDLVRRIKSCIVGSLISCSPSITKEEDKVTIEGLTLITGMALGIDTLFALIAIEFNIPFVAAIPFIGQENVWPKKSKDIYYELLHKARYSKIVSKGGYSAGKMQVRNEWMVDECDILIGVFDGSTGGTANCIHYCKEKYPEKEIIIINPKTI